MHGRQHDLLVFRSDHCRVFAGDRIRQRDLFEKLRDVFVAQRVLRELLEIVQPRLRVRELRPRVVGVAAFDDETNCLRRIVLHRFDADESQHVARAVERAGDAASGCLDAAQESIERIHRLADARPHIGRRLLADFRIELEDALPRQLIARIRDDLQIRHHVFDVRLLEEANAGANLVRDQSPRQLHLQFERLIVRAIQHRDVGELFAFVAQLENALRYE